MPYATNHGVRIHYRVEGEGQELVLQHGFTWSMDSWVRRGYVDALKPFLADMQRCVKEILHATFTAFPGLNHPEAFYQSDLVLPLVMKFLKAAA